MKKKYQVKLPDGFIIPFYVNNFSGHFHGELWIPNPQKITNNKYKIADPVEFNDDTLEGFLCQVEDFIRKNFGEDFTINEQ